MSDRTTALLMVDFQQGFDEPVWTTHGNRNNPDAEEKAAALLAAWRDAKRPIFHARHLSREPGSPLRSGQSGSEIKSIVAPLPEEPVVEKSVNSCFIGTDLERRLREVGAKALVIAGLTTDHCVSTTARMAANLGFETFVISDATATFGRQGPAGEQFDAEEVHEVSLASLHGEFALVLRTDELLRRLEAGRGE